MKTLKKFYFVLAIAGLISACGDDDDGDSINVNAGTLTGGPFMFIGNDGVPDMVSGIEVTGEPVGANSSFVITDEDDNILGLPGTLEDLEAVDFDTPALGTCFIWYVRYEGDITGLTIGEITADIVGDFDISNSIQVSRNAGEAILEGGPFNFIVDGEADNIPADGITVTPGSDLGNTRWVVTDEDGNILGLPPMFTAPEFDDAGGGTCFVYYISYEDGLTGLTGPVNGDPTGNINTLDGNFLLSNGITVNRLDAPALSGGPFTFTVSDGEADNLEEGDITMEGGFALDDQSRWIVTDDAGNILGLPESFTDPDFDGAGEGTCYIYYITYAVGLTGLTGPDADENPTSSLDDLDGIFELSNQIGVIRQAATVLEGGPFDFIVDGTPDNIPADGIDITPGTDLGESRWVVTDNSGNILGLPEDFTGPEFDEAGPGTCFVYYISYATGLTGLTGPDGNGPTSSLNDLEGEYILSNGIQVNRLDAPEVTQIDVSIDFIVNDGQDDFIGEDDVEVVGGFAPEGQSTWVVTDDSDDRNILGLPPSFTAPNFEGAGPGVCYVYYIAHAEDIQGLTGPDADGNPTSSLADLVGVHELSDPIEVNRAELP